MRLSGRFMRRWLKVRLQALRVRRRLVAGHRIVIYRSGLVKLEPFESLRPAADQVLVRIHASAVSPGTERANYLRLQNTSVGYPHMPGYSAAGIVVRDGAPTDRLARGTRVAVTATHASHAVVPRRHVHPIPDGPLSDQAAALWQIAVIAWQGVERAGLGRGARIGILGQGLIGLFAARLARMHDVHVEIVVRSRASEAAAASADAVRDLQEIPTDAREGYDIVLDCTGDPEAVLTAARAARRRGTLVLVGSSRGRTAPFEWHAAFAARELTLVGAHLQSFARHRSGALAEAAREVVRRLADGSLAAEDLVGTRWDPREAWRAYRALGAGEMNRSGAWFDWTVLSEEEACRSRSLFRGPLRWTNEEDLAWEQDPGVQALG